MRFEIITIFPDFFSGFFENGILRRALAEERIGIGVHDLRAFTHDRHRTVDDRPFGGGEGMVLKPEPMAAALHSLGILPKAERMATEATSSSQPSQPVATETDSSSQQSSTVATEIGSSSELSLTEATATCQGTTSVVPQDAPKENGASAPAEKTKVILMSAQGRPFTQAIARQLAATERVVLICGRYEGVDERINQLYCDYELSIGDYVLSGGELAAAVVIDATMRLLPGVLGNEASSEFESFGATDAEITTDEEGVPRSQHGSGGLLDYPHFTRPATFAGIPAPEVLLNGDHKQIRLWRREQQLRKTLANRPDLLEGATLSKEDKKILQRIRQEED